VVLVAEDYRQEVASASREARRAGA
jgi:hypothetical protein